nr:hypothetical protein [Tanacetum cinerariifolium]
GLQTELESIGQVFSREVAAAKARKKSDIPAMTAVYAVQPTAD